MLLYCSVNVLERSLIVTEVKGTLTQYKITSNYQDERKREKRNNGICTHRFQDSDSSFIFKITRQRVSRSHSREW